MNKSKIELEKKKLIIAILKNDNLIKLLYFIILLPLLENIILYVLNSGYVYESTRMLDVLFYPAGYLIAIISMQKSTEYLIDEKSYVIKFLEGSFFDKFKRWLCGLVDMIVVALFCIMIVILIAMLAIITYEILDFIIVKLK